MEIFVQIENIQHITSACIAIPFDGNQLFCIVGRNGVGKTSIVKALRNLRVADTYNLTSDRSIFSPQSRIVYRYGGTDYLFEYDENIGTLNSKTPVPRALKDEIDVELPMPHGERFNYFQTISNNDAEIRQNVVLENYSVPQELIDFLSDIYGERRFDDLREIRIKNKSYFCLIRPDSRYIREDYFSSGEFFVISLYRKIRNRKKLIVIDEIDISLDAAAQVHLIKNLRRFCADYSVNIVFTTHSLAMLRSLDRDGEILYLTNENGQVEHNEVTYNYVRSILFGFTGWDRYILTEDKILNEFIEHIIRKYIKRIFSSYTIVHIAGGSNTVDLMTRNRSEKFFTDEATVICVLDGDQTGERYAHARSDILFVPFLSVEKDIYIEYQNGKLKKLPHDWKGDVSKKDGKGLYIALKRSGLYSQIELFEHLCEKYAKEIRSFVAQIEEFLAPA
ncbi:AAA family ATPase [Paraburkholderia sp. BCC1885]|uniref:AAA family ATPase n=1 Tax=Paraburkholderia sp. BCC1885 TaxID=2562669 RepID=UPI0011836FBB|nr:AAA family ATPase [Paraburkholderia sp. BCC1885]